MRDIKILNKVYFFFFIISLLTIVLIMILTNVLYRSFYIDHQVDTLSAYGHNLVEEYEQNGESFAEKLAWANESLEWQVIFTDNPMLLSGGLPSDIHVSEHLISFEERQTLLNGNDLVMIREHERLNQDILAVVVPLMEDNILSGAIFLYTPLSAIQESFQPLLTILTLALLVILLLIFIFAVIVTRYIVNPIRKMTTATKQFGAGNFEKRIHLKQQDEIGQLADSFNTMASSLERTDEERREFLSNVSHELRTPISNMKGFTEAVEEGIVEQEKYVAVMKKETARVGRLVHDLLDLAQLERVSYPMNKVPLPFSQIVLDVVENFSIKWKEKAIIVNLDLDESLIVYGDPDRLEQVITNLLQNAYRYSNENSLIAIRMFPKGKFVFLQVEDSGVGIPEDSLAKITERFYRVNKARTSKDGGTGIGLAIVQQIIKKHHGELIIESEEDKGTVVTIKLPLLEID